MPDAERLGPAAQAGGPPARDGSHPWRRFLRRRQRQGRAGRSSRARRSRRDCRQHELSVEFWPTVDGHVIPEHAADLFERGQVANVPLIIGNTTDEGTLFAVLHPVKTAVAWREFAPRAYPVGGDDLRSIRRRAMRRSSAASVGTSGTGSSRGRPAAWAGRWRNTTDVPGAMNSHG